MIFNKIRTFDPSVVTMDHLDLHVSIFMEKTIDLQRVKGVHILFISGYIQKTNIHLCILALETHIVIH